MTDALTGTDSRDGFEDGGSVELLHIENLEAKFSTDAGMVQAVRGVSLTLASQDVLGIVGESGSGKSVTALALMGLLAKNAIVEGSVKYRGRELIGLKEKDLSKVRGQQIAMIFQDPLTSLNPVYTVGWQIAEAVQAHRQVSKKDARVEAIRLLETVGIPQADQRVDNYPHEFSGGMRQRVVIAIAMANNPDVILADEPTTALDVTVQAQVLQSLKTVLDQTKASLILITHDLGVIAGIAHRVAVMYAGRVVEVGTADDIFYGPAMPYTHGLLGSVPRVDADGGTKLRQIPGSPPSMVGERLGCPFAPRCPMRQAICNEQEPELLPIRRSSMAADLLGNGAKTNGHSSSGVEVHMAACHFADQVVQMPIASMFPDSSADQEVIAEP